MNRLPRRKQRAASGPARSPPNGQSGARKGRKGEESKGQRGKGGIREEEKVGDKQGRKKRECACGGFLKFC